MTPLRYSGLAVGIVLMLAISLLPASAQVQPVQGSLLFTITSAGITGVTPSTGGLYDVTVRNDSGQSRGIVMTGVDLCCSPYTRYTSVLRPGQEVTFRWFFPSDRQVEIRDLLRCKPAQRSCSAPLVGGLSTVMTFT